jgi:hypothetical protein
MVAHSQSPTAASLLQDTPEVRTQIKQQFPNASDDQISQMIQMQNQKLQQQQTAEKKSPSEISQGNNTAMNLNNTNIPDPCRQCNYQGF